jgi:sarcosine oxidase
MIHSDAPSLWADTAPRGADHPPLASDIRAGVAIIGGGFTGLSAALHLAEAGGDAVVLEARRIGFGASGRNGGQVIAGLKDDPDTLEESFGPDLGPRLVAAVSGAPAYLFALAERLGVSCDARPTGWIQAAHSEAALGAHARRARQWQARGIAAQLLDAAEARRRIGSSAYVGGWFDPRGGTVQPLSWVRGLGAAAVAQGARIYEHTTATRLSRDADGWCIDTPGGRVRAARVIIATNGYADGLLPAWRRSLVPVHSLQVATEPLPGRLSATILPGREPVSDSYNLLRYYQIDPAGRLVLGCRGPFRDRVTAADGAEARAHVRAIFPELSAVGFGHVWAGSPSRPTTCRICTR